MRGWGVAKGAVIVRNGRLRKELIARHFVRQIKEVGRGYSPSLVGDATATPVPQGVSELLVTSVTQDDQ